MTGYVVTANRLDDGEVVYLTADRTWSVSLADSDVLARKEDALELVSWSEEPEQMKHLVGPYEMEVDVGPNGEVIPLGQREIIRAKGPTVHPHFGKQAS